MLAFDGVAGLVLLGVWIFCIIDVITTPEGCTRNLPKMAWLFIVILLSDIGSLAWLVAGRPWNGTTDLPYKGNRGTGAGNRGFRSAPASAPSGPGALARPTRASNPDDDEEFLAGLRARAEEQRRRAREQGEPPTSE